MAETAQNEIELLEESIRGNADAFEAIVKKYQSFICAITFSATADVGISEDIAQEAFLHVWHNLSQLKDLHKFRSWLISITRNTINDSLRRQKHDLINKASPIEQVEDAQIKEAVPGNNKDTALEQQAIVKFALMEIPEKYREPLVLFYRQEKTTKEIAEQLEMSQENVKKHLERGRKLLREQVAAMVENAISRSGPTNMFTAAVMASVAGIAVKSAAAAGITTAVTSLATSGGSLISGMTAKLVAAAAIVAISIGTVVMYRQFTQSEQSSGGSVFINSTDIRPTVSDSNKNQSDNNIVTAAVVPSSAISQNTIAANIAQRNPASANSSNQNIISNARNAGSSAIALGSKPASSPYEYFLFDRIDRSQGLGLKTLVLGHITDDRIEFTDIKSEVASNYHWYNPLCVTGGKIYFTDNVQFFCLDLTAKQEKILLNESGNSSSGVLKIAYPNYIADDCLYQLLKNNKQSILQEIDFENQAYRDIADINTTITGGLISISPDKKHLGFFTNDPNGYLLRIVDLETGKVTYPIKPIQFINTFSYNSSYTYKTPEIPIIWLDSQTVAFIHSKVSKDKTVQIETIPGRITERPAAEHVFSVANINTGLMEDIIKIPGNPNSYRGPKLFQDNIEPGPLVYIEQDSLGAFRIDLKNHKLIQDDLITGDYSIDFEHLYYKNKYLGQTDADHLNVSADGKRILWLQAKEDNPEIAQLFYHDNAQDKAILIAQVPYSSNPVFWFKKEDLVARPESKDLTAGWKKFQDSSSTQNKTLTMDAQKDPFQNPTMKIETDKKEYLLHEPVKLSGKFTNIYNMDFKFNKPVIGRSNYRIFDVKINTPLDTRLIEESPFPYKDFDEVHIKPGESYSEEYVIEPGLVGDYAVIFFHTESGRGTIIDYSLEFSVLEISDPEKEQKLFKEKYTRLMDQYHRGFELDPNWSGGNIIGDEVIGLSGMGQRVAPFLIEALKKETNFHAYKPLLMALCNVASVDSMPFLKEQMQSNNAEKICGVIFSGIFDLYRKSTNNRKASDQALEIFLIGINHQNVEIRRRACSYLTKIYNERIETCFENTIEDEDEQIRLDAGYYLAAAKWLELADWLKQAANEQTYEQYIAATSVIKKLEQRYNISKGKLPSASREDFKNADKIQQIGQSYKKVMNDWLSWAQENPRASFLFFEDYRRTWWENDPLRQ